MTPVTNNNNKDLRVRDEENNPGPVHEIILRSLPNENKMPANHPEEEPDGDEQPFSHGHWRPAWAWTRSRALTALLAAATAGVIVGTGSVAFRAAGGKPSTITSNKQVENANVPGYEQVDVGECVDANSQYYPVIVYLGIATFDECATKCNTCVAVDFPTFVGMMHGIGNCRCLVSQTDPSVDLSQFEVDGDPCKAFRVNNEFTGTGPINGTIPYPGETCYKVGGGGGSKAGKTSKAPKSG